MGPGSDARILECAAFDKVEPSRRAPQEQEGGRPAEAAVVTRHTDELLSIRAHLSRGLARTHDARTLYAADAKGGGRNSAMRRKMSANRSRGMATSAIWKTT
jgi:hypothetical protein